MLNPRYVQSERPRIRNLRAARGATQTRVRHNERARYSAIVRVSLCLGAISVLLVGYVVLTSNLTGMTYAIAKAQEQRAALEGQSARLDDRLDALESQDRLATIAARLGMGVPQRFAVVRLPAPVRAAPRIAWLPYLGLR